VQRMIRMIEVFVEVVTQTKIVQGYVLVIQLLMNAEHVIMMLQMIVFKIVLEYGVVQLN